MSMQFSQTLQFFAKHYILFTFFVVEKSLFYVYLIIKGLTDSYQQMGAV